MEIYLQFDKTEKSHSSTEGIKVIQQEEQKKPSVPTRDEALKAQGKNDDKDEPTELEVKPNVVQTYDSKEKLTTESEEFISSPLTKPIHTKEPEAQEPAPALIPTKEDQSAQLQARVQPIKEKYKILLVGVGSAPMLKKTKFLLSGKEQFGTLQSRLKRMLKLPATSNLYLYINQAFLPSSEDLIGDLGDLFCVGEELQIHYSLQEAFL